MKESTSTKATIASLLFACLLSFSLLTGCSEPAEETPSANNEPASQEQVETTPQEEQPQKVDASTYTLDDVPAYSGEPYVEINGNKPNFTDEDKARDTFEEYSPLDYLGRCGATFALVGVETMPTEERGSIGEVKPSGWHTVRYNGVVDGNYLYNRCHLLGYQLTGENANEQNLITGTRYMNTEGMLPFENRIADYIDATNNHVLLRVTPIFDGENLVASGVQMEALSIEDKGNGICFNVYCYNVQPQIEIDYATGESRLVNDTQETASQESVQQHYVLNTNSKKFHLPDCSSVDDMSPKNKKDYMGTREDLINQGYDPCGRCNP